MKNKKLPKKRQLLLPAPKDIVKKRSFFEELEEEEKKVKNPKHLPGLVFVLATFIITLFLLGGIFLFHYIVNIQYQTSSNPILVGPITTAPKSLLINIDQPDDNLLTFDSSLVISGETLPNSSILISTDSTDLVIEAKSDGSFSTVLELTPGLNRIKATVFDAKGNMRSSQRTVFFTKEKI